MGKYLGVIVQAEGPEPLALFRDAKVGRQWAVDHFPGSHKLEYFEFPKREPEAVAVPTAPSLSPEVVPPPAPSAGLPQTKVELEAAGEPHTSINFSGDPDLRDHDEAAIPKSVKRRSKKAVQ